MPRQTVSDEELMQAIAAGDEAFAELVQRHRPRVYRLVRAYVRDPEHAEDLAQEVFCRVSRHAGNYVPQGSFVPWLRRIAINLAKNFLRRQRQTMVVPLSELEEEPPQENGRCFDPAALFHSHVVREEVRALLQALPEEQRLVLVMRYFGGMTVAEIA